MLALLPTAVLGAAVAGAGPAAAAPLPIGRCTTSSGVVLAVDFSHWGGPLLRSCGTTPTTGYELLNQGGWQTTGTAHDGPAFICRIGYGGHQGGKQYPTPAQDSCVLTPPATAYWSYWHADPGQNSWTYSQLGAMSYHPKPGSVDLWIFGATNIQGTQGRPTFSPDTVRARNTAPTDSGSGSGSGSSTGGGSGPRPTTKPPTKAPTAGAPATHPAGSGAGASHAPGAPATGTPNPTATTTATPTASGSPTATGATPAAGAGASTAAVFPGPTETADGSSPSHPAVVDAAPTAAAHHSSGSVLPFVITAVVVALIASVTVVRVRQRRRAE